MPRAALLLIMLFAMALPAMSQVPQALEPHQWRHRVILVAVVEGEVLQRALQQLEEFKAGVKDRDLVIIDLSKRALGQEGWLRPDEKSLEQLRDFASIEVDDPASFLLVGKDGGHKARQKGELELPKFFALIDTMPMRQREMRERN